MIRHTIHYSGRVQGVGFRYTVRELASGMAVSGIVENLSDGRVRLEAEGEPAELARLKEKIAARFRGFIKDATVSPSPATGEFGTPGVDELTIRR